MKLLKNLFDLTSYREYFSICVQNQMLKRVFYCYLMEIHWPLTFERFSLNSLIFITSRRNQLTFIRHDLCYDVVPSSVLVN